MAESPETQMVTLRQPQEHCNASECLEFLYRHNSHIPRSVDIINRYERSFDEGLQPLLLLITQSLKRMEDCVIFLRRFQILDRTDCEVLMNDKKYQALELKLMYLVDLLERREVHSYWYFVHSLNTVSRPVSSSLYDYLHGDIRCCVCSEVKEEEDKIRNIAGRKNTNGKGTLVEWDSANVSPVDLAVGAITSLPVVTDIVEKFSPACIGGEAFECALDLCMSLGVKSSELVQDRVLNNISTLFS